jgi:hypothetical protein
VDIEGGHPILDPFYFTVNSPAISPPLKAGWYFGTDTGSSLFGGLEINSLSEYDLGKLGWYKYVEHEYRLDKTQVMDSFSVDVDNCDKDDLKVHFKNKYSAQSLQHSAVELSKLYRTSLSKILRMDSERRVEVSFRQYSNIDITLTLEGHFTIQKISDISHFTDFSGAVMMDKHSYYFVNITVYEGEGSIRGNLTVDNNDESVDIFKINIDNFYPKTKVFYVRLNTICRENEKAILCLYTESGVSKCKSVQCNREPLQTFELPDSSMDYEKGEKMSILSFSTWAKHLNPLEWFNGLTNWKEGFIMVTEIVGVLTLLGLGFKLLRILGCVGRCWGCICKNGKDKAKRSHKERRKAESDEAESVEEVLKRVRDEGGTIHYNRSYRAHSPDNSSPNSLHLRYEASLKPGCPDSTPYYIDLDQIHTLGSHPSRHPTLNKPSPFLDHTLPSSPFSTTLPSCNTFRGTSLQNNKRIGRFGPGPHSVQVRSGTVVTGGGRSQGESNRPGIVTERFYDVPNRRGRDTLVRSKDNSLGLK